MNEPPLSDILNFCVESAQLAGRFTLSHYQTQTPVELKQDRSPVTAADRGAEELIRTRIERYFPQYGVIGEEFGERPGAEPGRFILDPIDGTFSFVCGVPLYSVLVAFEWESRAVAGVIHLPALGETVYAAHEQGCWWDGKRASVSETAAISDARLLVTTTKLVKEAGKLDRYSRVRDAAAADRGWSDAYMYALIATGRAEIALDPVMNIWDAAAPFVCVTEAGGQFSDWEGRVTHAGADACATNARLHAETLALLTP
jgi:histidinol-phosphatase